ncbi:MAG: DUF1549 domain-containing protein [Planctomycetota bacterium]
MKRHPLPTQRLLLAAIWFWLGFSLAVRADEPIDFAHRVVPILKKHCAECHAGDQQKGGFSINTRESLISGGESGAAILAADGAVSELIQRLQSQDREDRMPPSGDGVSAEELKTLQQWIAERLPWEPGYTFGTRAYEPPLKPRRPELPSASTEQRTHPIDRILDAHRSDKHEPLTQTASDAAIVRRLHLDIVGLLPTPEETQAYIKDSRPDKRARRIRELLERDIDYAEHWLTFWNDLLRNDYSGTGFITGGRTQISKWLYAALVNNKPYDVMARELIAPPSEESAGFANGIKWRGEVSAGQTVEIQFAQSVGQAFLGINLKCASCHDSFIDRWTLRESYGLAAIYSKTPLTIHRCDKPTEQNATAAWLFPEIGDVDPQLPQPERLKQLADLMTHPENGRFSRTIANRIWYRMMGYGIVHPMDAMQSQPWNEDLLDHLAITLQEKNYDLKELIALIASSEAYASLPQRTESHDTNQAFEYAGIRSKRLSAEQFVDAVWQLTGAAPGNMDAAVVRSRAAPSIELAGKWIWSDSASQPGGPAAGESVTFRTTFDLDFDVEYAFGVITCDNGYRLWINGHPLGEDAQWESVEGFSANHALQRGANEIIVVGSNGGQGPNPAALFVDLRIQGKDTSLRIATSEAWQTTSASPTAGGTIADSAARWKPAVIAIGPWDDRLRGELTRQLATGKESGTRMVRASLVKSDFLMRSLGRPNRDQIVSMRPTDLTTLEAMDLSNGQTLADWIHLGAIRWMQSAPSNSALPEIDARIIDPIYLTALSRKPSDEERTEIHEWIGPTLQSEELEDILWSILMLPEFQFVR